MINMHHKKGFSLVEAMIALVLVAAGVAVFVRFESVMLRDRQYIDQENEAVVVARNKINQLRGYSVIPTTSGQNAYDDIISGSSSVVKATTTYNLSWTVTTNTNPDYKTVRITVSWTDSRNQSKTVVFDTIIGKVNPADTGKISQSL